MTPQRIPLVLCVEAYDPLGSSGALGSIDVLRSFGLPTVAAVTAIQAPQTRAALELAPVEPEAILAQIDAICGGRIPNAIKIGFLPSPEAAEALGARLATWPDSTTFVADPSFEALPSMEERAAVAEAWREHLLPRAHLEVLNIDEFELLHGARPASTEALGSQAGRVAESEKRSVLLSGAGLAGTPEDVLAYGDELHDFKADHRWPDRPGKGTRLATAATVHLARGRGMSVALRFAHAFTQRYLTEPRGT